MPAEHKAFLMEQRMLTEESIAKFVAYCETPAGAGPTHGWFAFPVRKKNEAGENEVLYWKLRSVPGNLAPGKCRFAPKGAHAELFGAGVLGLEGASRFYVCEGELDCILLLQSGLPAVTSTAGALSWNDEWCALFPPDCEVVLVFDNDDAGEKGLAKVGQSFVVNRPDIKLLFITFDEYVSAGGDGRGFDVTDFFYVCRQTGVDPVVQLAALVQPWVAGPEEKTEVDRPAFHSTSDGAEDGGAAGGAKPEEKKRSDKEKFIRETILRLTDDAVKYFIRGERVYFDTVFLSGSGLVPLEGMEFVSVVLALAKEDEDLLLRSIDADLIRDHVRAHASRVALPLSRDNRSCISADGKEILINTGWPGRLLVAINTEAGTWAEKDITEHVFEPLPSSMRMVHPLAGVRAEEFTTLLAEGIADFGENHTLVAVACATMLLPATFPHPFMIFVGDQARGKSTTMKLLLQMIDPYDGGELMTIGEDARDLVSLCRDRHCIAMDNVSSIPFDEDLLSKMYTGGIYATRKMTTNSELSEAYMPRLRVMMNGIGTAFSRSDLMSRCLFLEHPVLTTKDKNGDAIYVSSDEVEMLWAKVLPRASGALLDAVARGWKLFLERGGMIGKTSKCRFVEFCVLGECISVAMGEKAGVFTGLVEKAVAESKEGAIGCDDCAQLCMDVFNGITGMALTNGVKMKVGEERIFSATELYNDAKSLAVTRGYNVHQLRWLNSLKSFSQQILRSKTNIENANYSLCQISGGEHNKQWNVKRVK